MDQFQRRQSITNEFTHSCLGRIVITAVVLFILSIVAIMTAPKEEVMIAYSVDNIRQCLQYNDSIKGDVIDEVVANIGRTFTVADSTLDNKEIVETCEKHNTLEAFRHTFYSTARIRNNKHPEGVRVGFGIFGLVISTVFYEDILMDLGAVRGKYNEPLLKEPVDSDPYLGENPYIKPYHYQGNPDN